MAEALVIYRSPEDSRLRLCAWLRSLMHSAVPQYSNPTGSLYCTAPSTVCVSMYECVCCDSECVLCLVSVCVNVNVCECVYECVVTVSVCSVSCEYVYECVLYECVVSMSV